MIHCEAVFQAAGGQPDGREALEGADEPALRGELVATELLLKVSREKAAQAVAQEGRGGE